MQIKSRSLNVGLLERVARAIVANAQAFDMEDVVVYYTPRRKAYDIAGWALKLSGVDPARALDPLEDARNLLGLSHVHADGLFNVSGWPARIRRQYRAEGETTRNAKAGAAAIRCIVRRLVKQA